MTHAISTLGSDYDLPSLFRLAGALLQAPGIIPQHFKKEGEIVAVILTGRELGLPPMTALRGLQLVKGKVVIDASLQLGLMVQHGVTFQWLKDGSDGVASIEVRRAGQAPFVSTWTLQMARDAGLAGGDTWKKYPAAMLRARAISAAGKAYMPDVMAGLYVPGELPDDAEHPANGRAEIHVEQSNGGPKQLAAGASAAPRGTALPEESEAARIHRELYAVSDAADLQRLREEANVARKRLAPDEREAIRTAIDWAQKRVHEMAQKPKHEDVMPADATAGIDEPGAHDEPDPADEALHAHAMHAATHAATADDTGGAP